MFTRVGFAKTIVTYQGQIDFTQNQFDLVFNIGEQPPFVFKVQKKSMHKYMLSLDVDHFKTALWDISSKISIDFELGQQSFFGNLRSQYSLIDYKPIRELASSFEVKDNYLYITALSFGDVSTEGGIGLKAPYSLNMIFHLYDMPMKNFLGFWMQKKTVEAEGHVSGKIKVSGDLAGISLKGDLSSFNGEIEKLKYDSVYLNAEGIYPKLYVADSKLSEKEGLTFMLEGVVNLADKKNFKKQIKALKLSPVVKDSSSKTEWTIIRKKDEEAGSVETNYFLRKEKRLDPSMHEGVGVLGVEKKMTF